MLLCTSSPLPSAAQSSSPAAEPLPSVLTRLQRVREHEDVCVLVSRDGQYRLERRLPQETRVYVGSLSPSELQGLATILNADELRKISPTEVYQPLMHDTRDLFLIDIFRGEGQQHLQFSAPESREPFHGALEPV